jgi:hypothetical protein
MTISQKVRMLSCAAFFVVAAYPKVRPTPQNLRALPANFFETVRISTYYEFIKSKEGNTMENEKLPMNQNRTFGTTPRGLDEAIRLSKIMAASGLMPKAITTPEAVFVAMLMGAEVGLSPMASVQNIAVINGKPGIYGDATLAVVRASGLLEEFKEWTEGERKTPGWIFHCRVKRKGFEAVTGTYSWAEACEAGFDRVEPVSPWKKWTNRMMQFKARNFVMRDQFADILKGIRTVEENTDAIDLEPAIGNNGREQYQIAQPVEAELSGTGSIDENAFEMLAVAQYPEGQDRLMEFMTLTAKANNAGIDDLKARAVANWNEFIKAFETWLSKQDNGNKPVETPPPPETETNGQENTLPVSYSTEYKTLMSLKKQFPKQFAEAKKELNIAPDTVTHCINLATCISRKVDQEAANADDAGAQAPYKPATEPDTSGF